MISGPECGTLRGRHLLQGCGAFEHQATLRDALIDQRRRELFLEGQHLGDVIRLGLPLTPPAGSRFPAGGVYGSQLCLFLPDVERQNNPVLGG